MTIDSNKKLKQFYKQELRKFESPIGARCIHFGECGGCSLQHISYEQQVELKAKVLANIWDQPVDVIGADREFNYRFKMDYVCAFEPFHTPNNRMGLRRKRSFRHVIDLQECHLIEPTVFQATRRTFEYALDLGLKPYDLVKHTGYLRYIVLHGWGDQLMLTIVTSSRDEVELMEKLAAFTLEQGVTSLIWQVNESQGDVSVGETVKVWGNDYVEMNVPYRTEGLNLRVGADCFFQNNILGFAELLNYVRSQVQLNSTLLDYYCGVGTIGLALANDFTKVIGIEVNPQSIEYAQVNAKLNGISNVEFKVGDARENTEFLNEQDLTMIVDPPRTGLQANGVEEVLRINPEQLIYISCNPITQRQDWESLQQNYEMVAMRGFDLFPQTLHLENVLIATRRH